LISFHHVSITFKFEKIFQIIQKIYKIKEENAIRTSLRRKKNKKMVKLTIQLKINREMIELEKAAK